MAQAFALIFFFVTAAYAKTCPSDENLSGWLVNENSWYNPQNLKLITPAQAQNLDVSENECQQWIDCDFCNKHDSLFYEVTSSKCVCPSNRCEDIPPTCQKLKGGCKLSKAVRSLLLSRECESYCHCQDEFKDRSSRASCEVCGISKMMDRDERIVGGITAVAGRFPWIVSVRMGKYGTHSHKCGGSLISPRHILSAAHCVPYDDVKMYSAYLGKYHKYEDDPEQLRVTFSKIIKHPGYDKRTMKNDIAILVISAPVECNDYISPVCLSQTTPSKGDIEVAGWGQTKSTTVTSEVLREVVLPLIPSDVCNSSKYKTRGRIQSGMMCAAFDNGGKDACQGDSGGPAVMKLNGKFVQVGVVSWGFGCAEKYSPGVYADVAYYKDWIAASTQ